jgi:hypothetical protein
MATTFLRINQYYQKINIGVCATGRRWLIPMLKESCCGRAPGRLGGQKPGRREPRSSRLQSARQSQRKLLLRDGTKSEPTSRLVLALKG